MIDDRAAKRFVLWAGAILGLLTFVWLYPGLKDVGIAWDEPYYFDSSTRIQDWASRVVTGPDRAGQFSQDVVRDAFNWRRYWNPHPPAYKLAMAATEATFGRWTGEVVGFRLTPLGFFSLLVVCVTWFAGLAWGRAAGVGAGLSLLLMPRVVGHAHIGATDMVTTFAWFVASAGLVLYVLEDRRRYLAIGSAALGLALATKFTGYLIPVAILLWLIPYGRSRRAIAGAILWGLGGLVVAWALNPLMWHDPVAETIRLVQDSLARDEVDPDLHLLPGTCLGLPGTGSPRRRNDPHHCAALDSRSRRLGNGGDRPTLGRPARGWALPDADPLLPGSDGGAGLSES